MEQVCSGKAIGVETKIAQQVVWRVVGESRSNCYFSVVDDGSKVVLSAHKCWRSGSALCVQWRTASQTSWDWDRECQTALTDGWWDRCVGRENYTTTTHQGMAQASGGAPEKRKVFLATIMEVT